MLLALFALSARLFVPVGFMPESGRVALSICSGKGEAAPVWIDIGKKHRKGPASDDGHAPCGFAGFVTPMISGAPPQLLATAFLYIVAQGLLPQALFTAAEPDGLRPPLRGPPSV